MIYIVNDFSQESMNNLLKDVKRKNKKKVLVGQSHDSDLQKFYCTEGQRKNVAKYFGCLKWDIDGVEYQRMVRNEWD